MSVCGLMGVSNNPKPLFGDGARQRATSAGIEALACLVAAFNLATMPLSAASAATNQDEPRGDQVSYAPATEEAKVVDGGRANLGAQETPNGYAQKLFQEREGRRVQRFRLQDGVDVVGSERTTRARADETLLDIANHYSIGYQEIRWVNPNVDTWLPGIGTEVNVLGRFILPDAPREGIVINLAEMRLYYFPADEQVVETFPVSVGRMDWSTPLGKTAVTDLIDGPAWYPPQSIREEAATRGEELARRVPPGPDNPLGEYAIMLDIPGYMIHGTNRPWGIGMRATHGCIRLHPEDIEHLFAEVERGTQVNIVNQPFKAGWSQQGELYLQAFPLAEEERGRSRQELMAMATEAVVSALGERRHRVAGEKVRGAASKQSAELVNISRQTGTEMSVGLK